ncbi:CotH family protein [Viscerimonas tarda]
MKQRLTLIILILALSAPALQAKLDPAYLFSPKGVAEVHIQLYNDKKIGDIQRDEEHVTAEKLAGSMMLINSETSSYTDEELYYGSIKIKGRGNTSWGRAKKSYSLDLTNYNGEEDNPSPLLGMPAHEEWVLLAHWNDRSYMRNLLAYYLGRQMLGLEYAPRTRYVELYVNDEYRGLYSLVEKIGRDKERINVSKLTADAADQVLPRMSGGYILEAIPTGRIQDNERNTELKTNRRGITFVFKYPKPKNATDTQVQWMKSYLDEFEEAIYGSNYKDPLIGYPKYINENSFIDWSILHDLSKGVDNLFHCSVFIHKDRNGKLNMSAPWDFDISFGNHGGDCYYEDGVWTKKTHWFAQLYKDEAFARKVINRFDELAPLLDKVPEILETNYRQLETSGSIDRDRTKFPKLQEEYKDREAYITPTTVRGHVRWFREWFESRRVWVSNNIGFTQDENCERLKKSRPVIRIMNPEGFEKGVSSYTRVMPGYMYRWDGKTNTANVTYFINDSKEHYVQIIDEHGCISLPSKVVQRGKKDELELELAIQPAVKDNALISSYLVGNVFHINYSSEKSSNLAVYLYDMRGALVKQANYNIVSGFNRHELNLSDVSKGMYIVKYVAGSETVSKKIIL